MGVLGLFAVLAVLLSVGVKFAFAFTCCGLRRQLDVGRTAHQEAKRELDLSVHRRAAEEGERKQLESRRSSIRRGITSLEKVLKEFAAEDDKERAQKAKQQELLAKARRENRPVR